MAGTDERLALQKQRRELVAQLDTINKRLKDNRLEIRQADTNLHPATRKVYNVVMDGMRDKPTEEKD